MAFVRVPYYAKNYWGLNLFRNGRQISQSTQEYGYFSNLATGELDYIYFDEIKTVIEIYLEKIRLYGIEPVKSHFIGFVRGLLSTISDIPIYDKLNAMIYIVNTIGCTLEDRKEFSPLALYDIFVYFLTEFCGYNKEDGSLYFVYEDFENQSDEGCDVHIGKIDCEFSDILAPIILSYRKSHRTCDVGFYETLPGDILLFPTWLAHEFMNTYMGEEITSYLQSTNGFSEVCLGNTTENADEDVYAYDIRATNYTTTYGNPINDVYRNTAYGPALGLWHDLYILQTCSLGVLEEYRVITPDIGQYSPHYPYPEYEDHPVFEETAVI